MTNEEINIAITEACGWRLFSQFKNLWAPPRSVVEYDCDACPLPDYINDLNAMHEAEKVLTTAQMTTMSQYLHRKLGMLWGFATASQRAEAFVRTIGKWEQ